MTLCQKLQIQEGTTGRVESMQQSSATLKNQDVGIGLRKIVACSQPRLRPEVHACECARARAYNSGSLCAYVRTRNDNMAAYYTAKTWNSPSKGTKLLLYGKDHVRSKLRPFQ